MKTGVLTWVGPLLHAVSSGAVRPPWFQNAWLSAVCEGSVLMSESLFSIKKEIIPSGSVCESCMPLFFSVLVSQKPWWRDHPFLKDEPPSRSDQVPPASSKETVQLNPSPRLGEVNYSRASCW